MFNELKKYKKIFGIFGLLVVIVLFTAIMAGESFLKPANIENTIRWTALFGIIAVGVSFVIMTGGIDLSIGSVICLIGCLLAMSLSVEYQPEDLVQVTSVDGSTRTFECEKQPPQYEAGQKVSYLEKVYTVDSVDTDQSKITVVEAVENSESSGGLFRAHRIESIGEQGDRLIWRGTQKRYLRSITVAGDGSRFRRDDKINLLYEIGLPKKFTISHSTQENGNTKVFFFVRDGEKVSNPAAGIVPVVAYKSERKQFMPTAVAIPLVLLVSIGIGLVHGLLITKVKLQPFVVTLCGLLIYRGISRYITGDQEQGFGTEYPGIKLFAKGDFFQLLTGREFAFDIPMPFVYLTIIAVVAAIFLNKMIYGRYILALGRNQEAALYSGINTDRMIIVSYMICSFCAGIAAILFALDINTIQPSGHGEFYELYAIAAAVLGGCSLRGGEGTILGVIIAAAVMRVLNNAINLIDGIDTSLEFAIIGTVILLGVITDELVRKLAARRKSSG